MSASLVGSEMCIRDRYLHAVQQAYSAGPGMVMHVASDATRLGGQGVAVHCLLQPRDLLGMLGPTEGLPIHVRLGGASVRTQVSRSSRAE
eukprot:6523185-Alexandrium_andersonii.AAC.1